MSEPKIRWASRLPPRLLERLYESDAKGFRDEELCDDVGMRLYARCRTYVLVGAREVECPGCGEVFAVARRGESTCPAGGCGWSATAGDYAQSLANYYAHTGRAIDAFRDFHRRYPGARSYRDKILLIDTLIHSFHIDEATDTATKSVASKLLEGNKKEVVKFLDRLSAVDPASKERWREAARHTVDARFFSTEPKSPS